MDGFRLYLMTKASRPLSESSAHQYVKVVRRFLSWIADTGQTDPVTYLESHRSSWSPSMRRLSAHGLRHWFDFKCIHENPLKDYKVPRRPAKNRAEAFSLEEQQALYRACWTLFDRALLLTFADTGARASEVSAIRPADIDWNEKVVRVLGKGAKYRRLPLTDLTLRTLEEYWLSGDKRWENLTYSKLSHWFHDLGMRANIKGRIHLHRLRTTAAETWIGGEIGFDLVMQLMGHADHATTLYYTQGYREKRAIMAGRLYAPSQGMTA